MTISPPVALKRPHRLEKHGEIRIDDYFWLRERDTADVLAYLEAENDYLKVELRETTDLQACLFEEIKNRIKQTDTSVPYRDGLFVYYERDEVGKEYKIYCRRPLDDTKAPEQIILDVNAVAEGCEFCDVGSQEISPNADILAYTVDTIGRRRYRIRFRDLAGSETLPDAIQDVTSNVVWANDSQTVFYGRQNSSTLRPFQIYRHCLGTEVSADELIYEESDETFSCSVVKSRSKRYVLIGSYQTLSSEYRYLDADRPNDRFTLFLSRERDHEYHLDHYESHFYIRTNAGAKNFRLMETDERHPERNQWRELIPHRCNVLLEDYEMFRDHLVLQERQDGLVRLRVRQWRSGSEHEVVFDEPAYDAYIDAHNREPNANVVRLGYSSLTTPESIFDYDMTTRKRTLLKREEVLGGFDRSRYLTERLYAKADDGVLVPISLVSRLDTPRDGASPLLLHGYGAYGISTDASFYSPQLSLLDRGFTFAIAHVRGGEELGRRWYDDGRLLNKRNTFTDFIACADHLVAEGYTTPKRLFAIGGSAGGLLMGTVVNMRPELFKAVVAQVPFVDVLTTMLDESIPLTTAEYDEWGNPQERYYYDYIRSYSPYDNVEAKPYPHLLVMTGLHDSHVQYWEPAKWVAKLRDLKTDDHRLLLKTNMDAGHGGNSGRYRRYREIALQYAFLLDLADN